MKLRVLPLLVLATLLAPSAGLHAAAASDVKLTRADDRVRVEIGGKLFTEYFYTNVPRPFCYPIIGPGGGAMTRNYPMVKVPGEETDHPHHRSLWFAHSPVNGHDLWTEGTGKGRR